MADPEAGAKEAGNFLLKKIGPLPAVVWAAAAVAIYLYLKKRNAASAASAAGTAAAGGAAGATDAGLSSTDLSGAGSPGTTSGSGGSTTAGQYADNNAWARAAINFLVSIGVDPVAANSAVTQYITSQPLTTEQQAEVNLAIQSIGAPPQPPTPGTSPPPVVSPPSGGQVYASNPPSGVSVTDATSSSLRVIWGNVTNANSYTVSWSGGGTSGSTSAGAGAGTATITGLKPSTRYDITIQAQPAKAGDPSAQTSGTTAGSGAGTAAPPPAGGGGSHTPRVTGEGTYRVAAGDTLSSIAARFKIPGGWQELWQYNLNPANNSAQQIATLQQRGPDRLNTGETIRYPIYAAM